MEILKQKLASRKLWAAIFAAVLCIVFACTGDMIAPEAADLIKTAVYVVMAYIFGESGVDIFRQISDAMKEKYKIPDIRDLLGEITEDKPDDEKKNPEEEEEEVLADLEKAQRRGLPPQLKPWWTKSSWARDFTAISMVSWAASTAKAAFCTSLPASICKPLLEISPENSGKRKVSSRNAVKSCNFISLLLPFLMFFSYYTREIGLIQVVKLAKWHL